MATTSTRAIPAKPVPYTQEISQHWGKNYMAEDQRFAARRPDVLVYQTAPLERMHAEWPTVGVDLLRESFRGVNPLPQKQKIAG